MADPIVYFLYAFGVEDGPCKVGHSGFVARRKREIEAQMRRGVVIVGEWPVAAPRALAVERYVHWLLRDHHIRGEWFDAPREKILTAIEKALNADMDADHPVMPLEPPNPVGGEVIRVNMAKGTRARLRTVVGETGHMQFIREAVERELERREKAAGTVRLD